MGSFYSTVEREEAIVPRNTKFFIPRNYTLSNGQLSVLQEEGLQQGFPFEIAGTGAQRSTLNVKTVRKVMRSVDLDETSVKLTWGPSGNFKLSFRYDATFDSIISFYVRGKDVSTAKEVRVMSESGYYGPFKISRGLNQEWSLDFLLKKSIVDSFGTDHVNSFYLNYML